MKNIICPHCGLELIDHEGPSNPDLPEVMCPECHFEGSIDDFRSEMA